MNFIVNSVEARDEDMFPSSSNRTFHYLLVLALLLLVGVPALSSASASTQNYNPGGLIIPLYSYPSSSWNVVIQDKLANPHVPVIAVVNPGNGPGVSRESNYATWINRLMSVGITVVGYVYTDYGARSASSVRADIAKFKSLYGVNGIFLDQMPSTVGHESYYASLTSYAKSLGLATVVGNPGTCVPISYVGTVSILVIYERSGLPTTSRLSSCSMGQTRDDFAVISYGVSSPSLATLSSITHYARYVYLTNAVSPHPYWSVPSFFTTTVSRSRPRPPTATQGTRAPKGLRLSYLQKNPPLGSSSPARRLFVKGAVSAFSPSPP